MMLGFSSCQSLEPWSTAAGKRRYVVKMLDSSVLFSWIEGLDSDVLVVNPGQFTASDKHLWQSWTYWIILHVETCNTWNKDCGPSDVPILWKELTKHILRAFPSIWPALPPWATGAMHLQQWYLQFVPWNGVAWRSDILRSTTCNLFLK